MIRVYGTPTSPYVRRVRVVAHELDLACELVDTASEAGQAELRRRSPIWKIPIAEIAGEVVFDSQNITRVLIQRFGDERRSPLAEDDLASWNVVAVIDGALDSLINAFYLARDGVEQAASGYVRKQHGRAAAALRWLEDHPEGAHLQVSERLALPALALGTALAWIRFRSMAPVDDYPRLARAAAALEARPSFAATRIQAPA